MRYRVIFTPGAAREFSRLPKADQRRLAECLEELAENPRPAASRKLSGLEAYRLRSGDSRLIYAVKEEALLVLIVRAGHRREVYKNLGIISKRLPRREE
jgi:mRNA interferase RelE/StbE